MTRSNVYVTLSNGKKIHFVADSSSAPEHGWIVENMINPLLQLYDAKKEFEFIHTITDSLMEKRTNACYRYVINLKSKSVSFYEESYNYKTDKFIRGKDLTESRYIPYLKEKNIIGNHNMQVLHGVDLKVN